MGNAKEILNKYKILLTVIILLIASVLLYVVVFANEDIYENQIQVKNPSVAITDGTVNADGNFDANDEAGNDSSGTNKRVRNFDEVIYSITYNLDYKPDSTLAPEERTIDVTRNVIVDILVPTSPDVRVSAEDKMNTIVLNSVVENGGQTYNYYKYVIRDSHLSQDNNVDIILSNINGNNGDTVSPIIRVREETDSRFSDIANSTNLNEIDKLNIENVTISAKDDYRVRLYKGVIDKEETTTKSHLPVGILVYIPSDANKGIKGKRIPSDIMFDLNITSSSSNATLLENPTISNYSANSENIVADLPYSYVSDNGNAGIVKNYINQNNESSYKVSFTGLKYHDNQIQLSQNENAYVISTKIFTFTNQKDEANRDDITYTIATNPNISNTISDFTDTYLPFVGDYVSKIDFFSRTNSIDETPTFTNSGEAIYNYNEEFYIQNTIKYGNQSGDKLENGFINYIKIDNDAFKLENVQNVSDQSKDYFIQFNNTDKQIEYNVKYGLGEWNASSFELRSNRPSYCPNSLTSLSKEELMNLAAGPCVETTNNIKWVDTIAQAQAQNKADKIILVKLDVTSEYDPGVETILRLKAKVVSNYSNIGKTFQITSRGKTIFNNKNYFLSEIPRVSVNYQNSDMRYVKTVYSNNQITTANKTYVNNSEAQNNIGNTVLVSPFKSSINDIKLYDSYGSQKNIFYSSITDPIEFVITPVIYKSDYNSIITNATVSVYLPEYLEIYEKQGDKKYDRDTSGNVVTIDGVSYKEYKYNYSENDIRRQDESVSGTIPNLVLHAYIKLTTPDLTNVKVITRINGKVKVVDNNSTEYTDVTLLSQREKEALLTLRNTMKVNAIGIPDPVYIDENGTYEYNMRAINSTNQDAQLSMIYILPYTSDGIGKGSKFSGTISVGLKGTLPQGYAAYYTTDNAKTILTNELNNANINWVSWTDTTKTSNNVTAIKIVPATAISPASYFASENGITLNVTTKNNKESERYYNNFYMIQKNANTCEASDLDCTTTQSYSSNISQVSVYDKTISGLVFEDENYNGFNDNEANVKDVAIDLYKLSATTFDYKNPAASISSADQNVSSATSDANGEYKFEGLAKGNYYVKYTFNCNKYTVTEKNKVDPTFEGDTSTKDSDAQMVSSSDSKSCYAVSNIITLDNQNVEVKNIDLGLRVRQEFDIEIKKYITNVKVISNGNIVQDNNYDKKDKVSVSVKNLKNTSFKVTYGIEIQNTKYFPGTIGSIIETIPQGMTFDPNLKENDGWVESDGNLYYTYLNKTLIMPGEKYYLTIVLDLTTNQGGNYVNIVAADSLQIKQMVNNFLEVPEEIEIVEEEE